MGQKVNPHGLRVGVIKDWDSKWYAEKDFADNLVEDYNIRTFLKKKLYSAGVAKIEIERASERVKVIIYTAKPGVVIGKGGSEIEKVKKELQKYTTKKLIVDIKEVKRPDKDAQLVAENIALQLENRISFRRAMKSTMQRTMKAGAKGIKDIFKAAEALAALAESAKAAKTSEAALAETCTGTGSIAVLECCRTELVVLGAFLFIRQDAVRFVDFLEFFFCCLRVVRVAVRMVFER